MTSCEGKGLVAEGRGKPATAGHGQSGGLECRPWQGREESRVWETDLSLRLPSGKGADLPNFVVWTLLSLLHLSFLQDQITCGFLNLLYSLASVCL